MHRVGDLGRDMTCCLEDVAAEVDDTEPYDATLDLLDGEIADLLRRVRVVLASNGAGDVVNKLCESYDDH